MPTIVLGVTGSIGAYRAADLVRRLRERGCTVRCILTKEAQEFITPLTLQAVSEQRVYADLFSLEDAHIMHTTLADTADLLLVAPATANIIGKLAHGLADDLLTCVALATRAPVLVAPAMNVHMFQHATVRENVRRLKALGYRFVGPQVGQLVCGYEALGHLAEVEDIVQMAMQIVGSSPKHRQTASGATKQRPAPATPRRPGKRSRAKR